MAVKKRATTGRTKPKAKSSAAEPIVLSSTEASEILRRGPANAVQRQEEMRAKISGGTILGNIQADIHELREMQKHLVVTRRVQPDSKLTPTDKKNLLLSNAKINVLSTRATILEKGLNAQFRLLNKVLPDLKALELSSPGGGDVFESLAQTFGKLYSK